CRRLREERGGVTVWSQTKQYQVKSRPFSRPRCQDPRDLRSVSPGGVLEVLPLSLHTMEVLRRNRRLAEQRLANHAVIALGMVGRHAALVYLEDVNTAPGKCTGEFRTSQQFVKTLGSRAA